MKKSKTVIPAITTEPVDTNAVRVLKAATCPSLSGKSTLGYHLGIDPLSQWQLRIHANSGKGFHSKDWIALDSVLQLLERNPKSKPLTSSSFLPMFSGKSINTSGFLLAVLKDVGLVRSVPNKQRNYEALNPEAFMTNVRALLESSGEPEPTSAPIEKAPARGRPRKSQ